MSGGFDYPPASDSASTPTGSLSQRFDNLRTTFGSDRNDRPTARTERSLHLLPSPPPSMPRPRRRFAHPRAPSNAHRPRSPASFSPTTPTRDTPRITAQLRQVADGTRAQLRRIWQEMNDDNQDVADELRGRRDLLDRMSTHLDEMETRLRGTDTTPLSTATTSSMTRRRANKRRKLDHDDDLSVLEPYGQYGQVEPGQLKMEIVSCDGGEYLSRDPRSLHLESYRPENVLRNDGSVYCTKSSRCNMMLRQKGETLFHLDRLVIAAPKRGYSAPIQQGLVFVGMSADKLTAATASYSIHYSDDATQGNQTRSPTPSARDHERLSLLEAANDDQIWHASRSRLNLAEPPYILPPPRPPQSSTRARLPPSFPILGANSHFILDTTGDDDATSQAALQGNAFLDNCDWPPPLINDHPAASSIPPSTGLTRAPTPPPPFTVITAMESSSDDDDDDTQPNPHRSLHYHPAPRDSSYGLPYALPPFLPLDPNPNSDSTSDTDPDDDDASTAEEAIRRRVYRFGDVRRLPRPVRRSSPGRIARHATANAVLVATEGDEEHGGDDDLLEPNASFFMAENERRVTIQFPKPLAGKFILLKLFSPHTKDDGNIDIEYVAAQGYSGPRFFPSFETK